jgi:D-alanyl-D-alanine carboxypeptidase/D-alanyl-D-alanine-endopeptidase (penicillin-binding protein 4)
VSGTIAADSEPKKIYRSMVNPARLAGEYLRGFLRDAGISIRGSVRAGKASGDEKVLLTVPSYDMRRIVGGLNTFSNNFIGDMLTKRFAAGSASPGSLDRGAKVIRDYLRQDVGIKDGFVIENGSGLSTENRLSADDIVRLLTHVENDMTVFPDFLASLPSYGWEGSLKRRMKGSDRDQVGGLIRAKSGTLSEPFTVSTLAGYLKHPEEGLVAFAVLVNGVPGKPQPSVSQLRGQQDAALAALLKIKLD